MTDAITDVGHVIVNTIVTVTVTVNVTVTVTAAVHAAIHDLDLDLDLGTCLYFGRSVFCCMLLYKIPAPTFGTNA